MLRLYFSNAFLVSNQEHTLYNCWSEIIRVKYKLIWIAKSNGCDKSHTDLSKYFIEKLKQQVDPLEIISNKHRTTNGLTLVAEIINVAKLTKSKPKLKNRLISLLDESKSKYLSSNIVNDFLLNKYFKDIVLYYKDDINSEKTASSEKEINLLVTNQKFFCKDFWITTMNTF